MSDIPPFDINADAGDDGLLNRDAPPDLDEIFYESAPPADGGGVPADPFEGDDRPLIELSREELADFYEDADLRGTLLTVEQAEALGYEVRGTVYASITDAVEALSDRGIAGFSTIVATRVRGFDASRNPVLFTEYRIAVSGSP